MLLTTEELLALVTGNVEPDRLADVLDRLERCPDSTAALQVLVTLRANRVEALDAIRRAEAEEATREPVPHPVVFSRSSSWATRGLQLAASVALAAMVGVWALGSPVATVSVPPDSVVTLATVEVANHVPTSPRGGQLAARDETAVERAADLIEAGGAATARNVLLGLLSADAEYDAKVHLFLGMAEYFDGDFAAAEERLGYLLDSPAARDDTAIARQAAWYRANALLALDQPIGALLLLEQLKADTLAGAMFRAESEAKYLETFRALGWDLSTGGRDER